MVCQVRKIMLNAMTRQSMDTSGLSRSPTTAALRKIPQTPSRFSSNIDGLNPWIYVHVQINKTQSVMKPSRLKIADCVHK